MFFTTNLNRYITRRAFIIIGIIILSITIGALLALSYSINKSSEQTYAYITKKNFANKLSSLELEFKKLDNYLISLDSLMPSNRQAELYSTNHLNTTFDIINQMYTPGQLISLQWYILLDKDNEPLSWYTHSSESNIDPTYLALALEDSGKNKNHFIQDNLTPKWLLYNVQTLENQNKIIYGITVDLNHLHKYLTTVDINTPNYAYIFTPTGLCIYHPEEKFIGKNIYNLGMLSPKDTINSKGTNALSVSQSEYLKLDIIRFLAPFQSDNFKGYITINFPKFNADDNLKPIKKNTTLILVTTVLIIVILFYLFVLANKKAYQEKQALAVAYEKVKQEKILIQLQQLKNQINPHFLFNSLNSLYMLINIDPKTATDFTLNLSKTYRYLIHPPSDNLVHVDKELTFIKQYIELQKTRFNKELDIQIIQEQQINPLQKIPFLALQITLENALKHNIATIDSPLKIRIIIESDRIIVQNNLQPKAYKKNSEMFGLNYLKTIYNYYKVTTFVAEIQQDSFICVLPLIAS